MKNTPPSVCDLSIVAIIRDPSDTPDALLAVLDKQTGIEQVQVLLVDGRPKAPASDPSNGHPWLSVITDPGKNMPHLKALGAKAARGRSVAFLEPGALPGAGWLTQVKRAQVAHPGAALGGGVDFAAAPTPANQAAFAFEYGQFSAANIAQGSVADLSANNMILPRQEFLALCGDILKSQGLNKPFCQQRLSKGGVPIVLLGDMAVALQRELRLRPLLKSRFSYARCFGGTRAALGPVSRRWFYRLGVPAVPFMLISRHFKTLRRIDVGKTSLASYLALGALCFSWAAGEAMGSWAGPGKACEDLY